MGKSFKRNGRWKKDRRDNGFRESKKFKDFNSHHGHHPPKQKESTEEQLTDIENDI